MNINISSCFNRDQICIGHLSLLVKLSPIRYRPYYMVHIKSMFLILEICVPFSAVGMNSSWFGSIISVFKRFHSGLLGMYVCTTTEISHDIINKVNTIISTHHFQKVVVEQHSSLNLFQSSRNTRVYHMERV